MQTHSIGTSKNATTTSSLAQPIIKPRKGIKMINRTTERRLGIPCTDKMPSDTILVSKD